LVPPLPSAATREERARSAYIIRARAANAAEDIAERQAAAHDMFRLPPMLDVAGRMSYSDALNLGMGPITREFAQRVAAPKKPEPALYPNANVNFALYNTNAKRVRNAYSTGRFDDSLARIQAVFQANKEMYDRIAESTGVPAELIAAMHVRENYSDFLAGNFNVHLHNGQVLGRTTTIVPAGIQFPEGQFYEAAVHALTFDRYRNDVKERYELSADSRDIIAMISWAEVFNGQGHFNAGRPSPYVFNGTNLHDRGTFIADGVFDPYADDVRPGIYLIIRALMGLE